MNSSVQCLAHAAPLVRVFLSGDYRQDLNTDNPLGNKGELAEAFGNLMKLLWQVCSPSIKVQPSISCLMACMQMESPLAKAILFVLRAAAGLAETANL